MNSFSREAHRTSLRVISLQLSRRIREPVEQISRKHWERFFLEAENETCSTKFHYHGQLFVAPQACDADRIVPVPQNLVPQLEYLLNQVEKPFKEAIARIHSYVAAVLVEAYQEPGYLYELLPDCFHDLLVQQGFTPAPVPEEVHDRLNRSNPGGLSALKTLMLTVLLEK